MAARQKLYDQFGPFVLYKKLEADALGDLWRATRIDAPGTTVALRRLSGGRREALVENAHRVAHLLPHLVGTSFVRNQQVLIVDGAPCLVWEYGGGRSLRHIIDQSRGTKDTPASPLPLDQALVIAEKIALSVATMADLRDSHGARLSHGALIPQFVWISDDGEIRLAGQQIGGGIVASLPDPAVGSELGRYFAPEVRERAATQNATDVYSMGALLFLLVTGQEPPDAATASAFVSTVRGAKTTTGATIPEDIRVILDKSLNIDPSMRFASSAEMKQAISAVAHSGRYSGSTFNLAFYLTTLLKKELETEALDRAREAKVDLSAYLQPAAADAPPPEPEPPPMFADALADRPKAKRRVPVPAVAAALAVALGAAGFMMIRKPAVEKPPVEPVASQLAGTPVAPQATPAPAEPVPAPELQDPMDPEAQKRAFDEAVRQRLEAEMMKLQNEFMASLKPRQPASTSPAPARPVAQPEVVTATADERPTLTAAEFDQQRREARQAEEVPPPPAATQPEPRRETTPTPPAAQEAVAIREGDLVDAAALDVVPRPLRPVQATYPAIAARQKISATIILTALISEQGQVLDVRILRGDPRFGLNDAAVRAIRATRYSPPMKDGKRVRTWLPQTITFDPN